MVISKDWKASNMISARWYVRRAPGLYHRVYVDMGDREKDDRSSWFRLSFYNDDMSKEALKLAKHIVDLHNAGLKKKKGKKTNEQT
jgi:hypothetical protein